MVHFPFSPRTCSDSVHYRTHPVPSRNGSGFHQGPLRREQWLFPAGQLQHWLGVHPDHRWDSNGSWSSGTLVVHFEMEGEGQRRSQLLGLSGFIFYHCLSVFFLFCTCIYIHHVACISSLTRQTAVMTVYNYNSSKCYSSCMSSNCFITFTQPHCSLLYCIIKTTPPKGALKRSVHVPNYQNSRTLCHDGYC